jgi:pyridoxamine 5'-phosphate oxidase
LLRPILKLADIRKTYQRSELLESALAADPIEQLRCWLAEAEASEVDEFNAMTLSTVAADGRPSSRIVLIKGLDHGLIWYTNYRSRKAIELAVHPFACLQFHWIAQERQVRIEGRVEKTSAALSDDYFASRPRTSRIGAWASPQSEVIANRELLTEAELELAAQFPEAVPRPTHWGGYRLIPDRVEFWQGRPSRMHDRLRYRLELSGEWTIERLAP